MSGNMAFFFDLVALDLVALPGGSTWWLYLVALYLVALYLVALYLVALYLVALYLVHQCAVPCTTLHHQLPPPISHR